MQIFKKKKKLKKGEERILMTKIRNENKFKKKKKKHCIAFKHQTRKNKENRFRLKFGGNISIFNKTKRRD